MRNRVALVLPYFGRLPNYFQLFLRSVGMNPNFNLLLVTDCDLAGLVIPDNVDVHRMSFSDVQKRIFQIISPLAHIKSTYKLCDYRPLYGLLFSEELRGYDFWGHCDADMLWGRLARYISDDILDTHDKFLMHGHFTLYRNDVLINELALRYHDAPCGLDMALSTDLCCYFDEVGMANVARIANVPIYKNGDFADITPARYALTLAPVCSQKNKLGQRFLWEDGRVLRRMPDGTEDEFMYIHLQKRQMAVCVDPKSDGWEIQEVRFVPPGTPHAHGVAALFGCVRQEGGFQLSRLKRASPERATLSLKIKKLRKTL